MALLSSTIVKSASDRDHNDRQIERYARYEIKVSKLHFNSHHAATVLINQNYVTVCVCGSDSLSAAQTLTVSAFLILGAPLYSPDPLSSVFTPTGLKLSVSSSS